MSTIHPAALPLDALTCECESRFTRRSGPGGQNRNKVETAVVLRHRPTGLTAEASERRSQAENLKQAVFRLRINLALAIRIPVEPSVPPSPLWSRRTVSGRLVINPEHDDYPALLAEALDRLDVLDASPRAAAEVLGCSATQLLKLLEHEPRAFLWLNEQRRARGLRPLSAR